MASSGFYLWLRRTAGIPKHPRSWRNPLGRSRARSVFALYNNLRASVQPNCQRGKEHAGIFAAANASRRGASSTWPCPTTPHCASPGRVDQLGLRLVNGDTHMPILRAHEVGCTGQGALHLGRQRQAVDAGLRRQQGSGPTADPGGCHLYRPGVRGSRGATAPCQGRVRHSKSMRGNRRSAQRCACSTQSVQGRLTIFRVSGVLGAGRNGRWRKLS
jgi:hypothetical protein